MTINKPKDANDECVGPQSKEAGKASSCQGCPNQSNCSSGKFQGPDPAIANIQSNLANVKQKILILSGKGGVGKSTFTSQIAMTFAGHEDDESAPHVGILDIDLCGPSIPLMTGLSDAQMRYVQLGMEPAYKQQNLGVVSIGFSIPKRDPVIWRGPKKNGLISQFLQQVYWGDSLDYLFIDTPPGTSDEHITAVSYLKHCQVDGCVIVTTPQQVSMVDVRRQLTFCRKMNLPILGLVENMAGFVCSNCKTETPIFSSNTSGGGKALCKEFNIRYLGAIPLDPIVMSSCEKGLSIVQHHPSSPSSKAFQVIATNLADALKET